MQLIENIYENKIIFPTILDRKQKIVYKKTFICGPRFCGKTYLIYHFLKESEIKNYLYIDMGDFKNKGFDFSLLESFIKKNQIKILIIEEYQLDYPLPNNIDTIILTSDQSIAIDDFHTLYLTPLDFEEFISFDTKNQSTTHLFNNFLKFGNLPDIIEYKESKKLHRNNELLHLITNHPTKKEIILAFIKTIGQTLTPYQIFMQLKKEIKISKDIFYNTIAQLESNHTLLLCPKYNQEKAAKRIFFYNYAFIDNVSYKKNFVYIFANMIYLELFNKNYEIYYLDGVDFYLPEKNQFIISMPFFNQLIFANISKKILKALHQIEIDKITIISVSNEDSIYLDNIKADVVPFYEWALGDI